MPSIFEFELLFVTNQIIQVYLAMEAGYSEKVDELCERYMLEGFVKAKGKSRVIFYSMSNISLLDKIIVYYPIGISSE